MINVLESAGIRIELLGGFAAAVIISWMAGDIVILELYRRRIREIVRGNPDLTGREADVKGDAWRDKLDLEFGRRIGRIERVFYIYAVMLNQFTLLSAWVILKAFYGWIQKPEVSQSTASEKDKDITTFYAYVYGNALSILTGIVCGHAGLIVQEFLKRIV
jgi:hypothetical protein